MNKKEIDQEDLDIIKQYFKDKKIPQLQAVPAGLALKDFLAYHKEMKKDKDPLEFIGKTLEENQVKQEQKQASDSQTEEQRIRKGKDKLAISIVLLTAIFLGWLYFF